MEIKNNLRQIRMREYGENPKEFAERINVNIKTYYTWENGNASPSLKECIRVANILNKDVKEIWSLQE